MFYLLIRGLNVVHVSMDKDMLQLVEMNGGTHIMHPFTKKIKGVEEIQKEFGVDPNLLCDFQVIIY